MSSVDYTTLPDPSYQYGNAADFHNQMKSNIIADLNPDGSYESNFCLTNAPNPQNITSQHIFHTTPAINADVDPSTNNRLCHRGYVLRQIGNVLTNDNSFSGANTFSGVSVFSNDIRCNQDPSLNNSLCRKSYVDGSIATCQPLITSSTDIVCNSVTTTNSITDHTSLSVSGNFSVSGTVTVPSASISQASINGLTTALNGKQSILSSSVAVTAGSLVCSNETDTGSLTVGGVATFNGGIVIPTGQTLNSVTPAQLSYLDATSSIQTQLTNLSSGLSGKQASLNSSTDLTLHNVTVNQLNGISSTTLGYMDATSSITTLLNSKQAALTSSSDIVVNSLNTIPSATIAYISTLSSNAQTQLSNLSSGLSGKQASLNSSTDLTLHNVTVNQLNGISSTTLGYMDATSSITTLLNSKQPTLTSASDIVVNSLNTIPSATIAYISTLSSNAQTQLSNLSTGLSGKQPTLTSASDIVVNSLNTIPSATIAYLSGLSSNLQSQLNSLSGGGGTATDANNAWSGTNSFNTYSPTTTVVASTNYDIPNKLYVDTQVATKTTLSAVQSNNNAFTGTTTYNTSLPTSTVSPSGTSDLTTKTYVDTQVATKTTLANVLSNNSTFSGTNTFSNAPTMSGANITSSTIPTSAIASGALTVTSLTCTSETDSGNLLANSFSEKLNSIGNNGTTNNYTLDFSTGSVFVLSTAPTATMTIILNNCGTVSTKTINFTMIYSTTGKYYANSVSCYSDTGSTSITLASSTPLYSNGVPSFSSSTVMVQTFTLIRNFASSYVLSNVVSYY